MNEFKFLEIDLDEFVRLSTRWKKKNLSAKRAPNAEPSASDERQGLHMVKIGGQNENVPAGLPNDKYMKVTGRRGLFLDEGLGTMGPAALQLAWILGKAISLGEVEIAPVQWLLAKSWASWCRY